MDRQVCPWWPFDDQCGEMTEMTVAPLPRERLLSTSYQLFSRRGVRGVGIDEIIARSNVAKATLYKHFPTKNDLVLAFLEQREELWQRGLVLDGARSRADDPEQQLLAIFDVFDDWFSRPDEFEACSFINILLEMGPDHPLGKACVGYLNDMRTVISDLAVEAGLRDPDEFARSLHILMNGSIISAAEGDIKAARRAKGMGRWLIEEYRSPVAF